MGTDPVLQSVTIPPSDRPALVRLALQKRIHSCAQWFLWIAGLSLLNLIIVAVGINIHFIVGLGVTQIIDYLAARAGQAGNAVAITLDLVAVGLFVGFGLLARQGKESVFTLGMIVYALDGLLFVFDKDILSIGFHLYALFWLYKGLRASGALAQLEVVAGA